MQTRKLNRLPLKEYRGVKAYLLTMVTAGRSKEFADEHIVNQCREQLRKSARAFAFNVYAYCFMPDHLHLLVAGQSEQADLISFVKDFKQRTGYWFRNRPRRGLKASPTDGLWQRSYHDHILRSEEGLRESAEYVLFNPVAEGLVENPYDYPFSGSFVWPELNPRKDSIAEASAPLL